MSHKHKHKPKKEAETAPRETEPETNGEATDEKHADAADAPAAECKGKILIVDDETEIQELLECHFRFLDYQVETASDGQEALAALGRERKDVVISDIKMKNVDGLELLREIRAQYPMTRSIIITAYPTLSNLLAAYRLGADTCVFKPITELKELEQAIEQAVSHQRNWRKKLKQCEEMGGARS